MCIPCHDPVPSPNPGELHQHASKSCASLPCSGDAVCLVMSLSQVSLILPHISLKNAVKDKTRPTKDAMTPSCLTNGSVGTTSMRSVEVSHAFVEFCQRHL